MLAGADLILAPSASAARVLAANGVDPLRLAVDENGLPDAVRRRARRTARRRPAPTPATDRGRCGSCTPAGATR